MVLFLIGVCLTLYMIRELVRSWHEPDAVHWVGPAELDPEVVAEMESDLHSTADEGKPKEDAHGHKAEGKGKQRPKCPYRQGNFTYEKPHVEPISCCAPLPSEAAKPKPAVDDLLAKLIAALPKQIRDKILDETDKIEKMRRQSNALANFVDKTDDRTPPPPPPPEQDSSEKEDKEKKT